MFSSRIPTPIPLVIENIYLYGKRVKKQGKKYNCECPFCREGKSAGKKRRFYYLPDRDLVYCHNCNYSSNGFRFLVNVQQATYEDVKKQLEEYYQQNPEEKDHPHATNLNEVLEDQTKGFLNKKESILPWDAINLCELKNLNNISLENQEVLKKALRYLITRRLNKAVNRPKAYYLSFKDLHHRERLILPYYNEQNQIYYFQSRDLEEESDFKYLCYYDDFATEKGLSGLNQLDHSLDTLYIFEGPIDSYFVRNGIALAGRHLTESQRDTLYNKYWMFKKVYVFDNDKEGIKASLEKVKNQESVFIFPKEWQQFKDFNAIAISEKLNEIPLEILQDHTYSGSSAHLKLKILLNQHK